MKQTVSTPAAIGVVVVIVGIIGFFLWRHVNAAPTIGEGESKAPSAAGRVMQPTTDKSQGKAMFGGGGK